MLHFMRQSQVLRTCPVAEIERCHWTLAHFDVHGLLIPASQILTAHLYELKKTLHWHPNSWSACGSSVQLPKPPPPALQQMEVLDCLRWSTGEPIQKKLREISNSCWDPCRFEMHLWGLILICLIYISVYLLQSDKNSVRSNTVAGFSEGFWSTDFVSGAAVWAELLPVSHRMWGVLSGSSREGRPASKPWGSGQEMRRGREDGGGGAREP